MIDLTNYCRWITASIFKHLDEMRQGTTIYVEGQLRDTEKVPRWMELRMNGPFARPCGSKDEYCFDVDVDILCSSLFDDGDVYHMKKLLGIGSQALNNTISVYKYGDGPEDDQSFVGCLLLKGGLGGIKANDFGQIEATTKIIQGTVEAHYDMYL